MTPAAALLHHARRQCRPVATLTSVDPTLDPAKAYAIQEDGLALRLAEGERIVGGKLGFTSQAMRQAMGVDRPNYGWLTDAMVLAEPTVPLDRLIHPKVEPEIAFLLGADLAPPVTTVDVLAATAAVMACLEVVDSRYRGFRFAALDNIADNSSAAFVALGNPRPAVGQLATEGVALYVDGRLAHTAAGAAALGDPAAGVAWMANNSPRRLLAGYIVISGGLTPPIDLAPGRVVTAEFARLDPITIAA